ncbi:MAG: cyclic nucleotide-binding domain-containing protein [Bryobacterales bacterium]|nr:cyclic nucleotide-binding domain-containing protein [Bryobacterales bacterium]
MRDLNVVEKVIALESVELLKNLTPDQLALIAYVARQKSYGPGHVILSPENVPDGLAVILDGSVELLKDGEVLDTAHQHDVLGSWALFDDSPLAVTARAVEETVLLEIRRDDFFDMLSDHTDIASSLFSTLVKRFRALLGSTAGA